MQERLIYHFTDHTNLAGIVADGGLHSDARMAVLGRMLTECANEGVKRDRRTRVVPCPPGGVVADYVPFYYAPRSPMMSAISNGKVPGYTSNQNLIYLVSSTDRVKAAGLRWACTDGNARAMPTEFYNTWGELKANTDWELMNDRYWADTAEDGDRRRRRMAEFLVHEFFPLHLVAGIAAKSQRVAAIVRGQLPSMDTRVIPDYYI
ncbi:type II toxin-antitoxin system toxin DNA ADP-ribosyl transferase DarT [Amycolatopsis magusensis]|uniref:type II toxin-antitoxin system toxin DNA ADP-ribosyl transferase DarT n=1 Tax=Amycolatopsis magusensis TaxID=882444 RepID=UPI003C2AB7CE